MLSYFLNHQMLLLSQRNNPFYLFNIIIHFLNVFQMEMHLSSDIY